MRVQRVHAVCQMSEVILWSGTKIQVCKTGIGSGGEIDNIQVDRAARFLRMFYESSIAGWNVADSYSLKHKAERFWQRVTGDDGAYISNGALIVAAHLLAFPMRPARESPHMAFRIRHKPIGRIFQFSL